VSVEALERSRGGVRLCTECGRIEHFDSDDAPICVRCQVRELGEDPRTTSWDPVDLVPILSADYQGPRPDVCSRTDGQALFYPGRVNEAHGEPESGKSWLAVAAIGELLEAGLRAVWLDFEDDAASAVDRLRRIGVGDPRIFANLTYVRPEEPLTDVALARLRTEVLPGATLVVVDATTPAMALDGLDPISTSDTAKWLKRLPAAAASAGAAVLILDHVVKDEGNRGRWAVGSQAKLAAVTGVSYSLTLRQPISPGQVGRSTLTIAKDRPGAVRAHSIGKSAGELVVDAREGSIVITIEPPLALVGEDAHHLRPADRLVFDVLPVVEGDALGWRAIGDRLAAKGHPLKKTTVLEACSTLASLDLAQGIEVDARGSKVFWRVDSQEV
jgi:hypothetical protein